MRNLLILAFAAFTAFGQQAEDIPPLQPPDLNSPYASPRDAARHRLTQTLANLEINRDVRAAVRGFADALVKDSSYGLAAFDFGLAAAASGRWEDAIAALEEAVRLDPSFAQDAKPHLERFRMIVTLDKSADGQRQRRYDEAFFPLLDRLAKMPAAEALFALAGLGRIDARRWEVPALLASRQNDYGVAAKFLAIAAGNAADSKVKAALEKALAAAEREVRYTTARAAAEASSDAGDHAKAAELFASAWTEVPARAANGLSAAGELLLENDTAGAAALLNRLRAAGDSQLADRAAAMLKPLEAIEPAAKAAPPGNARSQDPGPLEPPRLAEMLPAFDRSRWEVLARPLPKLRPDAEPPALLVSFSADPADASAPGMLPALPEPTVTFENAWRDILESRRKAAAPPVPSRPLEMADLAQGAAPSGQLLISSDPPAAAVLIDDRTEAACHTPCQLTLETGVRRVRVNLAGFKEEQRELSIVSDNEDLIVPLEILRGTVTVELAGGGVLKINNQAVDAAAPAQFSLIPGLYRFSADFGEKRRERMLNVNPGARLKLTLGP